MKRDLVIPSNLACIGDVRSFLDRIFNESKLDRSQFNRVFLGISEAVNNSIVHGNKFDTTKSVFISTILIDRKFLVHVKDEGKGFSLDYLDDPTSTENRRRECGRGIYLIMQFADDVLYLDGGSKVVIQYNFD